ncbi:hypothetical protein OEW28_02855 [Defluviimonas sp. WL0002]|uniref:Uncharacterized protein n=1 Tax=Albidovulum marisflavi TaxID=2984159 RepID=A0ABT2Z8V8_9RHOB|nr:hypothetical protein [Defluviimonas sp. WL0002]MCV2867564.1 hypothetical protein [Defluviimonas sp. WL0002]
MLDFISRLLRQQGSEETEGRYLIMARWLFRIFAVGVIGVLGLATYDFYRGGYFSLPGIPDNAYLIDFRDGFRAVVIDPEVSDPLYANVPRHFRRLRNANPDRRYLGVPFEVAPWLRDAWSFCKAPTEEERVYFQESMPDEWKQSLEYARLDAVCLNSVDGKQVPRGLIYSVPNL